MVVMRVVKRVGSRAGYMAVNWVDYMADCGSERMVATRAG